MRGYERGQRTVHQKKIAVAVSRRNLEISLCRSLANRERHWACNDRRSIGSRSSILADNGDLEVDWSAKTHVDWVFKAAISDGGDFQTNFKNILGLDPNGRSTAISLN